MRSMVEGAAAASVSGIREDQTSSLPNTKAATAPSTACGGPPPPFHRGGWASRPRRDNGGNRFEHVVAPAWHQDIHRIEAQDADASHSQPIVTDEIAGSIGRMIVRRAIDLDGKLLVWRVEIENERADRMLTTKARADAIAPKQDPELHFGQRQLASETSGADEGAGGRAHPWIVPPVAPSTTPRVVPLPRFAEEDAGPTLESTPWQP